MKVVVDVNPDLEQFLRNQVCDPAEWDDQMQEVANRVACHVIQVVRDAQAPPPD